MMRDIFVWIIGVFRIEINRAMCEWLAVHPERIGAPYWITESCI